MRDLSAEWPTRTWRKQKITVGSLRYKLRAAGAEHLHTQQTLSRDVRASTCASVRRIRGTSVLVQVVQQEEYWQTLCGATSAVAERTRMTQSCALKDAELSTEHLPRVLRDNYHCY